MRLREAGVALLGLVLAGCGAERLEEVSGAVEQQRLVVAALEARLQALESVPELSFILSEYHVQLEEQMFQPLLKSSARLQATGDSVPHTFYVDMLLQVEVPSEGFVAVNRQVFPVFEGKSRVELTQVLPIHGLGKEDIKVTLRPMNWYGSQRIPEARVTYQE